MTTKDGCPAQLFLFQGDPPVRISTVSCVAKTRPCVLVTDHRFPLPPLTTGVWHTHQVYRYHVVRQRIVVEPEPETE